MPNNSHVLVIADMLESTRQLNKYFIKKLDTDKLTQVYNVDGVELNSAYWVLAHTMWAEHYLTIKALGGPATPPELAWLEHYGINSDGSILGDPLSMKDLWAAMEEVHQQSQAFVRSLTDEELSMEPNINSNIWNTKRDVLFHAVRHEAQHMGHISWLCKLHGSKTI